MVEKPQKSLNLWSFRHLVWFLFISCCQRSLLQKPMYKVLTKGAFTKFNKDDIGETLLDETGLSIEELAKIEGYKNCIN